MKNRKAAAGIAAICFVLFIGITGLANSGVVKNATSALAQKIIAFPEYTKNIESEYRKNIKGKDAYVALNGLYARLMGNRECNQVIKLKNGMLLNERQQTFQDVQPTADAAVSFSGWLAGRGIPYLYVMAPYKVDLEKQLLPIWEENYTNEMADAFLNILQQHQVDVLDLRPEMSRTAAQVEENFFVTDHHWKNTAAFEGCKKTVEHLQKQYPDKIKLHTQLKRENWQLQQIENCYLGSGGQRTGRFFAGRDDLVWLVPEFETRMSAFVPYKGLVKSGSFEQAELAEDGFRINHDYYGYVGGNFNLVKHRNPKAPVPLKVLLLKDSYAVPFQSYLATVFQQVDAVDLRHLTNHSVVEYVDQTRPDLVIQLQYPIVSADTIFFQYGLEDIPRVEKPCQPKEEVAAADLSLPAGGQESGFAVVAGGLVPGEKYLLEFDLQGMQPGQGITAELADTGTDTLLCLDLLDENAAKTDGGKWQYCFYVPEEVSGQTQLRLYSGVKGQPGGGAKTAEDLRLIHYVPQS